MENFAKGLRLEWGKNHKELGYVCVMSVLTGLVRPLMIKVVLTTDSGTIALITKVKH